MITVKKLNINYYDYRPYNHRNWYMIYKRVGLLIHTTFTPNIQSQLLCTNVQKVENDVVSGMIQLQGQIRTLFVILCDREIIKR